jgi:hypothetical protein
MHDSFVHTIRELQGSDSTSQTLINLNGPFHSSWASLPEPSSQTITSKQHAQLIPQIITLEKTLEEILRNISTQVLETKYVINLGQLLRIVPNIKWYIFRSIKSI